VRRVYVTTLNLADDAPVPFVVVTETGPFGAPPGTVAVSRVSDTTENELVDIPPKVTGGRARRNTSP